MESVCTSSNTICARRALSLDGVLGHENSEGAWQDLLPLNSRLVKARRRGDGCGNPCWFQRQLLVGVPW